MADNQLPLSESFLIGVGGMFMALVGGCLSCALKSRCTRISFCGIAIERDVIPPADLQNAQVQMERQT